MAQPTNTPWTFLTNHALVLSCLARDSEMRVREVAVRVGVTERAVQRIMRDLESNGYLHRVRIGRRNRYQLRPGLSSRHQLEGRGVLAIAALLDNAVASHTHFARSTPPPAAALSVLPSAPLSFID